MRCRQRRNSDWSCCETEVTSALYRGFFRMCFSGDLDWVVAGPAVLREPQDGFWFVMSMMVAEFGWIRPTHQSCPCEVEEVDGRQGLESGVLFASTG